MKARFLRILTLSLLIACAAGVASAHWSVPALSLTATPSAVVPTVSPTPTQVLVLSGVADANVVAISGATPTPTQMLVMTATPSWENFQPTLTPSPAMPVLRIGVNEGNFTGQSVAFELSAELGQAFAIYMSAAVFDPVIEVYNPAGEQIAYDDDSGSGNLPFLLFVAPATESYRVVVDGFGSAPTGSYILNAIHATEMLEYDALRTISFDGANHYIYAFDAEAGDVITLGADSGGVTDTTLQLFAPDGSALAFIDDAIGLDPAFLYYSIGETGRYYVLHAPYGSQARGDVTLRLEKVVMHDLAESPIEEKVVTSIERNVFVLSVTEGRLYSVTFGVEGARSGSVYVTDMQNMPVTSVDFERARDVVLTFRAEITGTLRVDFTAHPDEQRQMTIWANVTESE